MEGSSHCHAGLQLVSRLYCKATKLLQTRSKTKVMLWAWSVIKQGRRTLWGPHRHQRRLHV